MNIVLLANGKLIQATTENKRYIYGKDVFFNHLGDFYFGNENKYGLTDIKRRLSIEDISLLKTEHAAKFSLVGQINLYKLSLKELSHLLQMTSIR